MMEGFPNKTNPNFAREKQSPLKTAPLFKRDYTGFHVVCGGYPWYLEAQP